MTGHFSDVTVSRLVIRDGQQSGWQKLFSKLLYRLRAITRGLYLGTRFQTCEAV